jgi:hypothetical protein
MSYAQWRNSYTRFVHLGIILILVLGFYSGPSGKVMTVYLFSLCVVSLLSSRFTASAFVWFSNFLKYLIFHFFRRVLDCESAGGFRCWNWRLSPIAEFHRFIWVWVLLCIGGVCFLLIVLIFFRVASAFVSLLVWSALPMSVFCRDACPGISLHICLG